MPTFACTLPPGLRMNAHVLSFLPVSPCAFFTSIPPPPHFHLKPYPPFKVQPVLHCKQDRVSSPEPRAAEEICSAVPQPTCCWVARRCTPLPAYLKVNILLLGREVAFFRYRMDVFVRRGEGSKKMTHMSIVLGQKTVSLSSKRTLRAKRCDVNSTINWCEKSSK